MYLNPHGELPALLLSSCSRFGRPIACRLRSTSSLGLILQLLSKRDKILTGGRMRRLGAEKASRLRGVPAPFTQRSSCIASSFTKDDRSRIQLAARAADREAHDDAVSINTPLRSRATRVR